MGQIITNAFEQYWQSSLAAEQPVVLDEFVLADIPNLDITSPINPDTGLPPAGQIVHRQTVDQRGRVNNNAVAYSIVMDTSVGDFSFNAMFLRNKTNGVIGMIVYKGRETKLKTDQATGQTGNSLVKSMLMGYDQAAEATLTQVDAGTWQIDYAARLRGMDEDIRQLQADLYGHHTFIDDGFKVVEKDGAYQVTQGVAIVGGLRIELKAPEVIYPGTKPIGVWVDVHRAGSLLSEHHNHFTIITSVADLADHLDGSGYQHYVAKLGTVQANNTVVDDRGITRSGETSVHESFTLLEQTDAILAINSREALRRSYAEAGYTLVAGSFENGGTVTTTTKVLLHEAEGKAYSWTGAFPGGGKIVLKDSTPANTGGGAGAWVDRSNTALRADLVADSGSNMIGTSIGSTVEAELAIARTNRNQNGAIKAARVIDVNGLDVEDDYQQLVKYGLSVAPLTGQGGVILLGDSIGNGQGAVSYKSGYLYRFMRSLLNQRAGVGANDQGYGYESYLNMATCVALDGISHTGTIISGVGAADNRLRLTVGKSLTITGRQAQAYDIFIDPALSSGNIEFYLNGVLYATKTVSSEISTFITSPYKSGGSIHPDDVVQIKASTGTLIVTGITTLREASSAPYVTSVCRSGWGFDEFSVQSRVDEVAAQVRFLKSGGPFTVFVMLGTNNIYHQTLHKTPSDYITALHTLVDKYIAALNGPVSIVLQVPLPGNEGLFPIIPGYKYADYVKAIVEYGSANGYPVIRFDRIGASNAYYADGIHPNNAGHAAMAAKMCDAMAVPYAYGEFHQMPTIDHYREAELEYNAKYKDYEDLTSVRVKAHKQGRLIVMSGVAAPNGATGADLIVGTLPKGMRPMDADVYTVASSNTGSVSIVIKRNGTVNVLAVPSQWISFIGVTFVIRPQS